MFVNKQISIFKFSVLTPNDSKKQQFFEESGQIHWPLDFQKKKQWKFQQKNCWLYFSLFLRPSFMKAKNVFQWWQRQKWSKYRYLTLKAPILRLTWELILMNLKLPYTWLEFDLFEIELNHVEVHVNPPENKIFLSGNVWLFICTHKDLSLPKDQAKVKFFRINYIFFLSYSRFLAWAAATKLLTQ